MSPIPVADARRQASLVHSPTYVDVGMVGMNGEPKRKFFVIRPSDTPETDSKAAADQRFEIASKLKPLGWIMLDESGIYGRAVT